MTTCPYCGSTAVETYRRDRKIGPTRTAALWFAECMSCGHRANSNYSINGGSEAQALARFEGTEEATE